MHTLLGDSYSQCFLIGDTYAHAPLVEKLHIEYWDRHNDNENHFATRLSPTG